MNELENIHNLVKTINLYMAREIELLKRIDWIKLTTEEQNKLILNADPEQINSFKLIKSEKRENCCICDRCFQNRDDDRNRLNDHQYCAEHLVLVRKVIMLFKREN